MAWLFAFVVKVKKHQKTGTPGDVMVVVLVKDHPIFRVEGANLVVDIPVSYTQVALGGKIEIPTLAEGYMEVDIPPALSQTPDFVSRAGVCRPRQV